MINIKLNPLWSKTVLAITFGFLLLLSSYILIDPVGSAENLLNIYNFFAVNFLIILFIFWFFCFNNFNLYCFFINGLKKILLKGRKNYSYFLGVQCCLQQEWVLHFCTGQPTSGSFIIQIH